MPPSYHLRSHPLDYKPQQSLPHSLPAVLGSRPPTNPASLCPFTSPADLSRSPVTRTLLNNVGNSVFILPDILAALYTMDFSLLLEKVSSFSFQNATLLIFLQPHRLLLLSFFSPHPFADLTGNWFSDLYLPLLPSKLTSLCLHQKTTFVSSSPHFSQNSSPNAHTETRLKGLKYYSNSTCPKQNL